MAGEADEPLVLLLIITVFRRLVFIRRRNRFQQRLRLLAVRNRRRRTEAYCFHSQRNIRRRRKVAWVLQRPQFWSLTGGITKGDLKQSIYYVR